VIAVGKRILQAILLLLTIFGLCSFYEGECARIRAEDAEKAVPMCLPVDLSRSGVYHGQYRKNFASNHGDYLYLEIQPAFRSPEERNEALAGLAARIVLTDEDGEQIQDDKIDSKALEQRNSSGWNAGNIGLRAWGTGTYNVAFHVVQPAERMSGRAQCLIGQYLFCGLEFMPALLLKAVGVGCWIVVGVIAFLAWVAASTQHKRQQPPMQEPAQAADVDAQAKA